MEEEEAWVWDVGCWVGTCVSGVGLVGFVGAGFCGHFPVLLVGGG